MLGNGIKQTTATTGAGNLTVAAATGYPALSSVFAIGQPFAYTLLDAAGLFLEAGIGYLADTATLVRARISATFSGGVYNASNPAALSLTGTTTVICTPHAATLESMAPTVDSVSTSMVRLLTSAARTMATASTTIYTGETNYVPFLLKVGAPIASLAVYVATAGAAGTFLRAGLYSCNEKGYIGGQIATTGNLDAGSTGLKNGPLAAPVFLPPGWYVTAVTTNAASIVINAYTSAASNGLGCTPFGWSNAYSPPLPIDFRTETGGVNSVLPATPSANTSVKVFGQVHTPLVWLGV